MPASNAPGKGRRVHLALVHHANQYVITDGYADREGMSDILGLGVRRQGLLPLLQMHMHYQVPLNLHLSGTLIETLAWHYPQSFSFIKRLYEAGLLEIVGSTFSQNIMPLFSDECNLRQIKEELWLYRQHLGLDLSTLKTFWVPERVWSTEKLAHVLRNGELLNKGYRYVLLDDRLLYPVGGSYAGSPRECFDREKSLTADAFIPREIAGGGGLVMLPISKELRYLIPPTDAESFKRLTQIFDWLASCGQENTLAVYGDDLEKAAGVGGWDSLHAGRYEQFLRWIVKNKQINPVLIGDWAAEHATAGVREIEHGTFYELAQGWEAGEDYRGWYEDSSCHIHRRHLFEAEQAILEAENGGADKGLLELGWKHLLHCSYETLWRNYHLQQRSAPAPLAPWAAALASHARSCHIIASAARWFNDRDHQAHAELSDIDGDGEEEVVLKNDYLFAVFSPYRGGRLIYLFDLSGTTGRLVVGNISDDWNLQEELNRYMDQPRNHPGALAEVGHEHDQYQALLSDLHGSTTEVKLRNIQPGSALHGTEKKIRLSADAHHLCVNYQVPRELWRVSTELCLSPNYYRLLRHGHDGVEVFNGFDWRGWSNASTRVWVRINPQQSMIWDAPYQAECGHGFNLRVTSFSGDFHLDVGVGTPPQQTCLASRNGNHHIGNRQLSAVRISSKPRREKAEVAVYAQATQFNSEDDY